MKGCLSSTGSTPPSGRRDRRPARRPAHLATRDSSSIDTNSRGFHLRASFRDHVFPYLGDTGVDRVTSADIMAALQPIWTRKHVTARKVHQRIGAVMRWAIS